jgi:hypothetical protein
MARFDRCLVTDSDCILFFVNEQNKRMLCSGSKCIDMLLEIMDDESEYIGLAS